MATPVYTHRHWAKSDRANPERIHLLEHHLADVGACFEALLAQPTILSRLATSAGVERLHDVTKARLCVFAALHDIGKVNAGFQTQIWQSGDLQGERKPRWTGHTSDVVPVLDYKDHATADWFFDALGWDEMLSWDDTDGLTACGFLAATLSHHGEPLNLYDSKAANPAVWRSFGELDPQACIGRVGSLVREWFPSAFSDGGPPLLSSPQFQHMFLGLCTLTDWVGSDERHFPYEDEPDDDYMRKARRRARDAVAEIGLDVAAQRQCFDEVPGFSTLFDIPHAPNAIQQAAQDIPLDERAVIIESEKGPARPRPRCGASPACMTPAWWTGVYFALPTRAAAAQIHGRVNRFVGKLFQGHKPVPVLAVPGYIQAGDFSGQHLQGYEIWWDFHLHDGESRRF